MSRFKPETVTIACPGGRCLEVVVVGPADGIPLVSHHGTPGAAGTYDRAVEIGAERGVRHISYSRPGYARSTRVPRRSVASCVDDVTAIADALGYERFYSIGGSGGGPHSIACAALLPDRVIGAAAIASPAPAGAEGLDWTAGMGEENVQEFAAMREGESTLIAFLERSATELSGTTPDDVVAALGDLVSEADRQALSGDLAEFIVHELAHALSAGLWGWFDDDRALVADWGFDLGQIRAPLTLWHGAEDRFVPIAHGEWLAAHLDADARLLPEHGHLSLVVSSYGEILDQLLAA